MKQILCMKWGTLYGPEYVNTLYSMVRRNITAPFRFYCLTDDPKGIHEDVLCRPCPTVPIADWRANTGWRKLAVWASELFDIQGDVLFLDLDVVIVSNIDDLFTFGSDFCVMRNWTQPRERIGNTSVFRFTVGKHPHILQKLIDDPASVLDHHRNEQIYISETISTMTFFPDDWCRLFKVHCLPHPLLRWFKEPSLPSGTKIVAFPGDPNPPDAAAGRWPVRKWYKRIYKHIRPTTWVQQHWR